MHNNFLSIGLSNPKTPGNVGAVMRAAGCFRAAAVLYTGIRFERAARRGKVNAMNTDTQNRTSTIALQRIDDLAELSVSEAALSAQLSRCKKVCVELVQNAIPLPDYQHPLEAIYIFGPEDGSLSQQTVDQADDVIYVPTQGCLNLAATVNIVLYDRQAKQQIITGSDELICQNRDTNNRLRVKTTE